MSDVVVDCDKIVVFDVVWDGAGVVDVSKIVAVVEAFEEMVVNEEDTAAFVFVVVGGERDLAAAARLGIAMIGNNE